jgi:hypothetical protein
LGEPVIVWVATRTTVRVLVKVVVEVERVVSARATTGRRAARRRDTRILRVGCRGDVDWNVSDHKAESNALAAIFVIGMCLSMRTQSARR